MAKPWTWVKAVGGRAWHHVGVGGGSVYCDADHLLGNLKHEREFPPRDGVICKGCLHAIADEFPGNLIGHGWFDEPKEEELE